MGKFIIGIDLGGTNLKIALFNQSYKIKFKKILSTRKFSGRKNLISGLKDSVEEVIRVNGLKKSQLLGVGLGLPGLIDSKRGIVHIFPNIPGWKNVPLKNILSKSLGLSIFMDNDVNLMALAEHKLGAAKGFKNALCLTLGTGVGGGLIIDGRLYRGTSFSAGEIGHLPVNVNGRHCNCGSKACLETYIGNNRILKEAREEFKRRISLEELSSLAKRRNTLALKIWRRAGEHLGVALSGVLNLLNLDAVVIGGGVANAGKALFDKVRETIKARAMEVPAKHVKIFKARLKDNAGLIGAAILVKEGL